MVKFQIKEFNFTPKVEIPRVVWTAQQGFTTSTEITLENIRESIAFTRRSAVLNIVTVDYSSRF